MLSLAAPFWLLGLVLLPAIRWLHRGGRHRRAWPVAHLGLWQGVAADSPAAGEKQPPDPAWRRRALLAALLLLALAEPRLPPPPQPVTLWLDDSLSMLTRELQGTRLALALTQAGALLAESARGDVEVRALGDPWQRLGPPGGPALPLPATLAAELETRIASRTGLRPAAPPAPLLRAEREHWLLTDGAHPALLQWPAGRRADRTVQVGSVTRNVGLATLAARRSADDPDRLDVLVRLSNGGDAVETRELVVYGGAAEAARSGHRLQPGKSVLVTVQVAATAGIRATLQPADALPEDDALALDLAALRRHRVAVDAGCPAALRAAVAAHPALMSVAADAADAAATLDCGGRVPPDGLPTLRVRDGEPPRRPPGPARWSDALPASQRVTLLPGQLAVASTLNLQPGDAVLLAAGDEPVFVARARADARAAPLIETSLDFDTMSALRGPQTPLLVNLVFGRLLSGPLLSGPLLDATATAGRGPAASFVVPGERAEPAAARPADTAPARPPMDPHVPGEGTRRVLWVAVLALLWEIAALAQQWRRVGRHAPAGSP